VKYIIRLDDITEATNWSHLDQLEAVFDRYEIKPVLGVVPLNKDKGITNNNYFIPREVFFNRVKKMQNKGYTIAMHGVNHVLRQTNKKSIVNINSYGEFTDISYQEKINQFNLGLKTLRDNGIDTNVYMPPAHWIDKDTIDILGKIGFNFITDGLFPYPKKIDSLWFIPQQMWQPRKVRIPGIFTICVHINNETQHDIDKLISFLEENHSNFINFDTININKYSSIFYKIYNFLTGSTFDLYLFLKRRK
jgi:hypothetical protein